MTKKVMILLGKDVSGYCDEDYYSKRILQDTITDWEEISEEDYWFLRNNLFRLFKPYISEYDLQPILVVKDDKPVMERIESLKTWIAQEKYQEAKAKADAEAKKLEKAKQRMLKKAASEKALFEELKKKFT